MTANKEEYVCLKGNGHGPIRFMPNLYGNGIVMLVDRGIPCAEHTQIFSGHTTDYIVMETIELVVKKHREVLIDMWDDFCNFNFRSQKIGLDLGEQVCQAMINFLADKIDKDDF